MPDLASYTFHFILLSFTSPHYRSLPCHSPLPASTLTILYRFSLISFLTTFILVAKPSSSSLSHLPFMSFLDLQCLSFLSPSSPFLPPCLTLTMRYRPSLIPFLTSSIPAAKHSSSSISHLPSMSFPFFLLSFHSPSPCLHAKNALLCLPHSLPHFFHSGSKDFSISSLSHLPFMSFPHWQCLFPLFLLPCLSLSIPNQQQSIHFDLAPFS